jgi:hypothetical protein
MGIFKDIKATRDRFEPKEKAEQYEANLERAKNVRRVQKAQGK